MAIFPAGSFKIERSLTYHLDIKCNQDAILGQRRGFQHIVFHVSNNICYGCLSLGM